MWPIFKKNKELNMLLIRCSWERGENGRIKKQLIISIFFLNKDECLKNQEREREIKYF